MLSVQASWDFEERKSCVRERSLWFYSEVFRNRSVLIHVLWSQVNLIKQIRCNLFKEFLIKVLFLQFIWVLHLNICAQSFSEDLTRKTPGTRDENKTEAERNNRGTNQEEEGRPLEFAVSFSLEKVIYVSTQTVIEINQNSDLKYSQLFERISDEKQFHPIYFTINIYTYRKNYNQK